MFVAMEKLNWFLVKLFSFFDSEYILRCYTQCRSWSLKKILFVLEFVLFEFVHAYTICLTSGFQENSGEQLQTQAGFPRPLDDHETPKENLVQRRK